MRFFRVAALCLPLLLAACSSGGQKISYAPAERGDLSFITYDRMVHNHDLTLDDIKELRRAEVSDVVTLRYLRHQRTIYRLSNLDIGDLYHAGVSREVVAFMLQTPQLYDNYHVAIGSGLYIPFYDDYVAPPPYRNYPDPSR
jgi:hypothetical protein